MGGLFFLFVIGLWMIVSALISRFAIRKLPWFSLRVAVATFLFLFMMIAPVIDEIVGGIQFRELCEKEAVLTIGADAVRGKTLRQYSVQSFPNSTVLEIERWRNDFVDPATGVVLASSVWMRVSGGLFIRSLGISEGNAPFLSVHPLVIH